MSNYTHRPTEEFCTEITIEIYEALLPWIKENKIPTNPLDGWLGFRDNNSYTHLHWTNSCQLLLFWNCDFAPTLPLSDFIAKFKTPTETDAQKRERLIGELIVDLSEVNDKTIVVGRLREIQSLKPKS